MTDTAIQPDVIEHLDLVPPCDTQHKGDRPPAEFVVRLNLPCGHHFFALWCGKCVAFLNTPGCWHCPLKHGDHCNQGIAIDWARIESLCA